jgi:hypothetical protein
MVDLSKLLNTSLVFDMYRRVPMSDGHPELDLHFTDSMRSPSVSMRVDADKEVIAFKLVQGR